MPPEYIIHGFRDEDILALNISVLLDSNPGAPTSLSAVMMKIADMPRTLAASCREELNSDCLELDMVVVGRYLKPSATPLIFLGI